MITPYERFEHLGTSNDIIVIWLNEEDFTDGPLTKFGDLAGFILWNESRTARHSYALFTIIGPSSSDTLFNMVLELTPCLKKKSFSRRSVYETNPSPCVFSNRSQCVSSPQRQAHLKIAYWGLS